MVDEWPFVRGGLRNAGAVSTSGPRGEPRLLWRHDAGSRVFGTPIVDDERVYVGTCAQHHHPNDAAVAIERATGDRSWMAASDALEVRGTPAIANRRLYLGDLGGKFFVVDVADGSVRQSLELQPTPADGVCPLVHDGMVFFQPWLDARDAESLASRWHQRPDTTNASQYRQGSAAVFETPFAIADGRLFAGGVRPDGERTYVGQEDGYPQFVHPQSPFVAAIDPETGATLWETAIDGMSRGTAVVDTTVFVAGGGSDPLGKRMGTVMADADEQPTPDEDPTPYRSFGTICALDTRTGAVRWQTRLSSQVRTMPAVDGDHLCVGTVDGTLVALDASTGEQLWERTINESQSVLSSPTIAGDVVYVGSDDDALVALEAATGRELWRFPTESAVDSNPSVVDGVVYLADCAGYVYALA